MANWDNIGETFDWEKFKEVRQEMTYIKHRYRITTNSVNDGRLLEFFVCADGKSISVINSAGFKVEKVERIWPGENGDGK